MGFNRVAIDDMERYLADGHFPPGSMGPKVAAGAAFVRETGRPAIITTMEKAAAALRGEAGTRIVASKGESDDCSKRGECRC